jgi:AraC-like DNA-binding protein
MASVWRARDVPRQERVYYMRAAVAESMVPLDMTYQDTGEDFPGWLQAADVGALRVIQASAPRGDFVRSRRLIRQSDPALFGLWMPRRHRWVVEQDDRAAELGAGEFTFVDLSRPFRMTGPMHDFVSVIFPRVLLPLSRQETRQIAGVSFSGARPDGALVSTLVRRLAGNIDACRGRSAAHIGSAVLELITGTLAARLNRPGTPPGELGHHAQLLRIHSFIEERLGDPALTPAEIAAAHHISLRQLYKLFGSEGKTVAGWVRDRRLERCRGDLLDPTLRDSPVSAIAARRGFTDPTHFSRAFRERYGVPPGEYRRIHTTHQH